MRSSKRKGDEEDYEEFKEMMQRQRKGRAEERGRYVKRKFTPAVKGCDAWRTITPEDKRCKVESTVTSEDKGGQDKRTVTSEDKGGQDKRTVTSEDQGWRRFAPEDAGCDVKGKVEEMGFYVKQRCTAEDTVCDVRGKPVYEVTFASKEEAVKHLMKFHVMQDTNKRNFQVFDAKFEEKSSALLNSIDGMFARFNGILLKGSMRQVGTQEKVMLEKLWLDHERKTLAQDKKAAKSAIGFKMPPPPAKWIPIVKEMVDKEIRELDADAAEAEKVRLAVESISRQNYRPVPGKRVWEVVDLEP